ncbi:MAG: SRPBCC domain-containing protein, partial [Sandaracinaceae bacterium]|nr:SRPBCC domain-containing protein [Sandaracinaceae bacterium]
LEHAVAVNVRAKPEILWNLLTDAAGFPAWNSTVTSIDGEIAKGNRLALRVPAAPERVFKPKVIELEPGRRMVWSDGMAPMFKGVRTFTLEPREDGSTDFTMVEVFSGLMVPMIASSLPDFGPAFEQYSADLKREGERRSA